MICKLINEALNNTDVSIIKADESLFEIVETDGKIFVDSEFEEISSDVSVKKLSNIEDFSALIGVTDKSEIDLQIKKLKNLSIERTGEVPVFKAGNNDFEDAGTMMYEFQIILQDYRYDSKKDVLSVKRFKNI